jgi:hypothetical protein
MPAAVRNTVDRLDKPSAYYQSRVGDSVVAVLQLLLELIMSANLQNKKRKYDRDEEIGRERTPEEPAEDPLKDATTLYVGNLYVACARLRLLGSGSLHLTGPSTRLRSRFMNYLQNVERLSG